MAGLFSRIKNWARGETIKAADLNAEFNNVITNFTPSFMDDYSASVAQMRLATTPGASGSESQATSLAGELERLRYVIRRALGGTYWYDDPATSLTSLKNLLSAGSVVAPNRIDSGRVDANLQPMFLTPGGTDSVKLKGASTAFNCYINNVLVTVSSDLTLSGLTGPTAFAALVNDTALTGTQSSKTQGENGTTITIDTPTGTPPTVGTLQAWKISTEYFLGVYASTTTIVKAKRGNFFNSSDTSLARVAVSNNDAITMCRLAYVFFTNASGTPALNSTYNRPTVAYDTPSGASSGDFWFDTNAGIWKKYSGSAWNDATAIFVGTAVIDATNTVVATRSMDFGKGFSAINTLVLEKSDNNTIQADSFNGKVNVYGSTFEWIRDYPIWDMAADLDSGVTDAVSTQYWMYLTALGDTLISDVAPQDRRLDLYGFYHPSKPWRCVGTATNDGSSNFGSPTTQDLLKTDQIQDSAITSVKISATNYRLTSGSGAYSSAATSFTQVTNLLTSSMTSNGRPIFVALVGGYLQAAANTSVASVLSQFKLQYSTDNASWNDLAGGVSYVGNVFSTSSASWQINMPSGSLSGVLETPTSGTTYYFRCVALSQLSSTDTSVSNAKLYAIEQR